MSYVGPPLETLGFPQFFPQVWKTDRPVGVHEEGWRIYHSEPIPTTLI